MDLTDITTTAIRGRPAYLREHERPAPHRGTHAVPMGVKRQALFPPANSRAISTPRECIASE